VQTIVKMTVKNISNTVFIIGLFLLSSCSKERDIVDLSYNENFKIEKIDSTGTSLYLKIQIDNYTFNNATDSVEYGLIYTYIDRFGYELNTKVLLGKFKGQFSLNDTVLLDLSLIKYNVTPDYSVQFYCLNNGIYDKSKKVDVIQNAFFRAMNTTPNYNNLINPNLSSSKTFAQSGTQQFYRTSFYEYPNLHHHSYGISNPIYNTFNVQTGMEGPPSSLYANFYNSSNYINSCKLFTVGSKNIILRDSTYSASPALMFGKLSVLDFQNNRWDMTGPNFPTSHFYQSIEFSGRRTLQSVFWFDFDTYAHVMLSGYNSSIVGAPFITKFIKFDGITEQFQTIETIPSDVQYEIEQNPQIVNSFITFNGIGYVNVDNKIYTYNPTSANKWDEFPQLVEGFYSFFIPYEGKLYFVTDQYVYLLNQDEMKMKMYNNNDFRVKYMIPFPYEENGVLKTVIYGDSASVGAQYQFKP